MAKDHKQGKRGLNIIIVGCGKVGASLTEQLYKEGHDITLVDRSSDRLQALTDMYDVMGIVGNGASYQVLQEADIEHADLMIAVTKSDEMNLLCCVIAKQAADCHTIARVRNPMYREEREFIRKKLGLSMIINPEHAAAMEMARLLRLRSTAFPAEESKCCALKCRKHRKLSICRCVSWPERFSTVCWSVLLSETARFTYRMEIL